MDAHKKQQMSRTAIPRFKSPKRKLISFFENSRDKWKQKTKDAKYQIKLLRKQIKYMEQNKNEYKTVIINQARQIEQMQAEIEKLKKNLCPPQ